ncbi:hypothetical protein HII31_13296 [Pseudocercospora fuligena]|uniref:Uncharacterized protein n=1 Tax=Pseudocercospora fuligena TaxID=685502 RepID=A0A8H6R7N1_9PEZI|nr:hypothetical protein HII31_13296 [Pseudocercospora fuligena]
MDSNKANREAEGLQAVENNDYPEVVPGSHSPYERRSSLNSPQPYIAPEQARDVKQHYSPNAVPVAGGYFPDGTQGTHSPAPPSYQG